ncbi:ABC transporter substrate-binding protein [Syntrophus buswellii]|uniref:ABC transporter substrate-binding protein n=1 Tax=Syntrophus buswellii TaxID=43774 RepID=UPI0038D4759F
MLKNLKFTILFLTLTALFLVPAARAAEIPTLKVGYIFTTHHTPFMVAATKGEAFKSMGVYLRPLIAKDRYELVADGKPIANFQLIVAKSGTETASLFARNQLDLAMASVTAMMSGIDKGTPIKILSPLQTEGMGLVVPRESSLKDWNSFLAYVKKAKKPVKVGYHSPTSAPKIVLEGSLKFSGIRVTSDPTNMSAQVLLVDLKETTNMVPALASKQVEAIVGPSPFPEVAVSRGVGKIIVNLRDLPPKGYWYDFPCCVTAASELTIAKHPDIVQKFVELIAKTNVWCNKHRIEAGTLTAEWIGLPGDTARTSQLVYLPKFTKNWMHNADKYLTILNSMGNFTGRLKGKTIQEVKPVLFDMRFIDNVKL